MAKPFLKTDIEKAMGDELENLRVYFGQNPYIAPRTIEKEVDLPRGTISYFLNDNRTLQPETASKIVKVLRDLPVFIPKYDPDTYLSRVENVMNERKIKQSYKK